MNKIDTYADAVEVSPRPWKIPTTFKSDVKGGYQIASTPELRQPVTKRKQGKGRDAAFIVRSCNSLTRNCWKH